MLGFCMVIRFEKFGELKQDIVDALIRTSSPQVPTLTESPFGPERFQLNGMVIRRKSFQVQSSKGRVRLILLRVQRIRFAKP